MSNVHSSHIALLRIVSNSTFIHCSCSSPSPSQRSLHFGRAAKSARVQYSPTDEWTEVATDEKKRQSENVMERRRRKKTVVNDVLITLVSLSNFLHTMNCLVHPNSQQKRKTTTPSTMTSTFVFEVTSAQRLHCWSVDNLLILTYGCNDVDFYRKINTATIGTQSILPSHRRRPN